MKKKLLVLSIALLGSLFGSYVMGQVNISSNSLNLGMPELSLLSASSTSVNLVLTTAIAGEAVLSSISDESARLKISSVITSATRTLSASVSAVPAGTTLTLQAQAPNGNSFGGTLGEYAAAQPLPTTGSATIITAIGSCYSGTAVDDGYKLKYTWGLLNPESTYANVRATGTGVTVTVTLTLTAI